MGVDIVAIVWYDLATMMEGIGYAEMEVSIA